MGDFIAQAWSLCTTHDWVGLVGLMMAVFVTLLTDRAKFFPTWDSPWRAPIGTLFGVGAMALNQLQHGNGAPAVVAGVLQTSGATLVAELAVAAHAKRSSGGGGIGATLSCFALWLVALAGCGGSEARAQSAAIRMAKEECQARALAIVSAGKTCPDTQRDLDELATRIPTCAAVLGGPRDFGQFCAPTGGGK